MGLEGRSAIVTGGASGIGRAIALRLARDGADVAILDLDGEGASATASAIGALGRRGLGLEADVSDGSAVASAIGRARRELGPPSILVNDAGYGEIVPFVEMSEERWDRMIAVHLKGAFHCTRALLQGMIDAGWGRIVNVSSVAGLSGAMGFVHYSAAKAALLGFTKALAQEVGASGVTVNAIAPGLVDTPILRGAGLGDEMIAASVRRAPVRRIGVPEDIAAACAYVVSEDAGFLTGQVLSPNGGAYL